VNASRRPTCVVWLCAYPAIEFADRPALRMAPWDAHPTPWITHQAPLVAATPGIELHVVSVGKWCAADDHFTANGIHFHFLRVPRVPRALLLYQMDRLRMTSCVRNIRADLVQAFGIEDSYALAAVSTRYPMVTRVQGIQSRIVAATGARALLSQPGALVPMLLERWTVRRCKHFITPTRFAAEFVRALNPDARTYAIKTPVPETFFTAQRLGTEDAPPEILFVGTVLPAKGVDVLLRAFAKLVAEHRELRLTLIGAQPDRRYMEGVVHQMVSNLALEAYVRFEGPKGSADVAAAMARARVLVLPTLMDTAPNVIVEAQVVGTPVIASNVGGVPDMIENGVTGLLVPPSDPEALAAALRRVLDRREWAEQMGATARAKARPDHELGAQVEKLVAVYRGIVGHV
jgi:glycosyltransferase involved in cell wall biosynthesis